MSASSRFAPGVSLFLMLAMIIGLSGCGSRKPEPVQSSPPKKGYKVLGEWYYPIASADGFSQKGLASWYGKPFHGRKTANGEIYNMHARTAAHKTLPLGTFVLVKNLENSKETVVRVNDRGPFVHGRIIDLSYRSAQDIDMIKQGTAPVEIIALDAKDGRPVTDKDFFTGDFTVQVGAFSDQTRAEEYGKDLLPFSGQVSIHPVKVDGQNLYRVRLGRFSTLEDAQGLERRLVEGGYNAFTVAFEEDI